MLILIFVFPLQTWDAYMFRLKKTSTCLPGVRGYNTALEYKCMQVGGNCIQSVGAYMDLHCVLIIAWSITLLFMIMDMPFIPTLQICPGPVYVHLYIIHAVRHTHVPACVSKQRTKFVVSHNLYYSWARCEREQMVAASPQQTTTIPTMPIQYEYI